MYLKIDAKLYRRAMEASTHVKILFNKLSPRFKGSVTMQKTYIFAVLAEVRDYVKAHAGEVPPKESRVSFGHNDKTMRRVRYADASLKRIFALLGEDNQRELKSQYRAVNNLLDDLEGYLEQCRAKGIWVEGEE